MLMTTPTDDMLANDVTGRATPEMIAAGVKEYFTFDARFEDADEVVERIWKAMIAASPKT
jgi:hypothetical protein